MVSLLRADAAPRLPHVALMTEREPDWYLQEWLAHLGKRQASLVNELGWVKGRANKVYHGAQPYRREVVNEIAGWLGIQPYELLMPPAEALAIRGLRETAQAIVATSGRQLPPRAPDRAPISAAEAGRLKKKSAPPSAE